MVTKNKNMKKITLDFIPSDFYGCFTHADDCAIGRATKRILGWETPRVTPERAYEDNKPVYTLVNTKLNGKLLPETTESKLAGNFGSERFNIIKNAVENGTFESASVDLVPI